MMHRRWKGILDEASSTAGLPGCELCEGLYGKRRPLSADWLVNLTLLMPSDPFWLCTSGPCLSCLREGEREVELKS